MEQITLQVTGMTCVGCEQRIQQALGRLEGVQRSRADHRDAEVRVVFDSARITEQALRTCIEQAGYDIPPQREKEEVRRWHPR